jgi:hypothetical protein
MILKIYNLGKICNLNFLELNAAIVNNDKVIFTDNEALHTVHYLNDLVCGEITAKQIIESEPVSSTDNLGEWVRTSGGRIEHNYELLLKSIQEIGLDPKDFPR